MPHERIIVHDRGDLDSTNGGEQVLSRAVYAMGPAHHSFFNLEMLVLLHMHRQPVRLDV